MRIWLAMLSMWVATGAWAGQFGYGTLPDHSLTTERRVRIGSSPSAISFEEYLLTYYVRRKVAANAVLLYVTAVHQPGLFKIEGLVGGNELRLFATATARIDGPGWVQWNFSPPLDFPAYGSSRLRLSPVDEAEVTFGHLQHDTDVDHQNGYHLFPGVSARTADGWSASLVFRFAHGVDRLASDFCPPGDRDRVGGFPYVHKRTVLINEGQSASQRFVWPNPTEWNGGLALWLAQIFATPASPILMSITSSDGRQVASSDQAYSNYKPEPQVASLTDTGLSTDFVVRVAASSVPISWPIIEAGDGLAACHPAVRAGFGGHRSRAEGQPNGSDFLLRLGSCHLRTQYFDNDKDGHGNPFTTIVGCATVERYVATATDCDDTDYRIGPEGVELCDGKDNDCDGLLDANDPSMVGPAPCNQKGVCAGSSRVNTCVAGAWSACDNGPSYSPTELACDGLDNDCNGFTEIEEPATPHLCEKQLGVCANATDPAPACISGRPALCASALYGQKFEERESTCDGLDNDCDGEVDEGCSTPRGCGCSTADGSWVALGLLSLLTASVRAWRAAAPR